jgi:hypothetical protein
MKKANLVFVSSIILFSLINISLVQADMVITVKYNDGCYVNGAFVEVWEDMDGTIEVCAGWTNIDGKFICPSSSLNNHGCPPKTEYWVQIFKPDDVERWFGSGYVNGTCTGNVNANLPVSCFSMESKQCVDGYCCSSACSGTCEACNLGGSKGTCTFISSGQDPSNECAATPCSDSCDKDSNPFTWDYADDEPNYCSGSGSCTSNSCIYNHVCADADYTDGVFLWESLIRGCTADCDQTTDYNLAGSTCNYGCDITNTCSYQNSCSINPYCGVDNIIRYYNGTCSGTGCSFISENCDNQDGWYNTSTNQWISSGQCTEKEQIKQEYHDYTCETPTIACTYSVTNTQWVDIGNTRNKPDGTVCDDGNPNTTNDRCSDGVCVPCICGNWFNTRTCCEGWPWPANRYERTCNPSGCDAEYKCVRTSYCRL